MKLQKNRIKPASLWAGLLLLNLFAFTLSTALADPNFVNSNFMTKWQRADKFVANGTSSPARSWLWGPQGYATPSGALTEDYADSPGGKRQVQYFDKARMELNNPSTGYVTNGLLVEELILGRLATGDTTYQQFASAAIPIAGDSTGNNGPTYASFAHLTSLNKGPKAPNLSGQPVDNVLFKDGTTAHLKSTSQFYSMAKYAYYESNLGHNIPDIFWNFMNQKGNVFEGGQLKADQPVLGTNPAAPWLDATGYPITEAYWAEVTVAGQVKPVLIQAFERRVLTYTPSNTPAFQVEMGNVGQHYYLWRYGKGLVNAPTVNPSPTGGDGGGGGSGSGGGQSYLEGTYNCFAQGVPTGTGYMNANTYLFRANGTWADITYGLKYANDPKYNFTYKLVGADLTLIYPSGNSTYKVVVENGKNKLVQYGDKYNQTCYQKV